MTLDFVGTPNATYYVVTQTNVDATLATWSPVAGSTNTAATPGGLWSITVTNNAQRRFYRAEAMYPCP
jgi:hypothetical protein